MVEELNDDHDYEKEFDEAIGAKWKVKIIATKKACYWWPYDELCETVTEAKVYEPFNEYVKQVESNLGQL